MLIESISGVRGTVDDGLTKEIIRDYVDAFHCFCPDGQIVIGRDSRPSGREFNRDYRPTEQTGTIGERLWNRTNAYGAIHR